MDCSPPGVPVHHQLPELAQTHVHKVGDAIQPLSRGCYLILCHPLLACPQSFPASGSFPMSQFFASGGQSIGGSKPSILRCLAFLIVQLSHPYMTTGKTIALTKRIFVGIVMSLLCNMLSRFVITFLPRSKASFNFMAAVTICSDFGAQKNSLSLFPLFPHLFPVK